MKEQTQLINLKQIFILSKIRTAILVARFYLFFFGVWAINEWANDLVTPKFRRQQFYTSHKNEFRRKNEIACAQKFTKMGTAHSFAWLHHWNLLRTIFEFKVTRLFWTATIYSGSLSGVFLFAVFAMFNRVNSLLYLDGARTAFTVTTF